jgi:hypothetical protein
MKSAENINKRISTQNVRISTEFCFAYFYGIFAYFYGILIIRKMAKTSINKGVQPKNEEITILF